MWKLQTQVTQGQITRSRRDLTSEIDWMLVIEIDWITLELRYAELPIFLKLSAIDIHNSVYKMYISEFS